MDWRNLSAFIFYRLKKSILGLGRERISARKPPPRDDDLHGPYDGGTSWDTDHGIIPDSNILTKQMNKIGQYQAGLEGGKQGSELPDELNLRETAEAARQIKKLVTNITRRRKRGYKRKNIDIRATIHSNMHHGGPLLTMRWHMKKPGKPRVILIMDTSSSMLPSARMMLQFLYALQNELSRLEVFIFGNQLNYATPYLQKDFHAMLKDISLLPQWNYGGTQLWKPLAQLRDNYSHLINSRTVVILLTDCMLYEKFFAMAPMDNLRRKVKRLYLFNPDPQIGRAHV